MMVCMIMMNTIRITVANMSSAIAVLVILFLYSSNSAFLSANSVPDKVFSASVATNIGLNPCFLKLACLFEDWLFISGHQDFDFELTSPADVGKEFVQVRNQVLKMGELV